MTMPQEEEVVKVERNLTAEEKHILRDAMRSSVKVVAKAYTPDEIQSIRAEARRLAFEEAAKIAENDPADTPNNRDRWETARRIASSIRKAAEQKI